MLLTLLLTCSILPFSSTDLCLTEDFCPPPPIKVDPTPLAFDDTVSYFLDRDSSSGCYCRLYPGAMGCFGREHCLKVPHKWASPVPVLSLHTTNISVINRGDFDIFDNVNHLYIEQNFNMHKIQPGAFQKLVNLTFLSISYNINLKFLESSTFTGLHNLRELYLVANGFTKILDATRSLSPKILPKLLSLSLKENNFGYVEDDAFHLMSGTALTELNLVLCRIEDIHPNAFKPLKNVSSLRIGVNNFNDTVITDVLLKTIQAGIPLTSLNLYSAGFIKKPPRELMHILSSSKVQSLNLSKNRFELINKDTFPVMPNIKIMDLSDVVALNITPDAFSTLPNLKTLILSGNKLKQIPDGILLENITYLDLQQNSGSLFFSPYFSVSRSKFKNMTNLQELNLSFNVLDALFEDTFIGLDNLRVLSLKNGTIRSIKNFTFAMLSKLELLNLENNYFVKNNPVGIEQNLFAGLGNLKVLLLGGNYIQFLSQCSDPFQELTSLVHLDLRHNMIVDLHPKDFVYLVNIRRIDLSGNTIVPWTDQVFYNNTNLEKVDLSLNKLSYFTDALVKDLSGIPQVDLLGNAFICDCSIQPNWYNSDLIKRHTLFCDYPSQYQNRTLLEFLQNLNGTCDLDQTSTRLYIILPTLFLVLIFAFVLFFLFYYRHHVRYWMFLTRLYLSRKGKISTSTKSTPQTEYKYDAFVSYSTEDRHFVIRLVTMLENHEPFLKLCVYERDFELGTYISDSVLQNVAKSRKTVLIISDNYAKSQWCRWESQIAHHHRLFFENDRGEYSDDTLILIKIGPVSVYHLTPTLKYLLKTRIYLQWDCEEKRQREFWERLRQSLRPNYEKVVLESTHM